MALIINEQVTLTDSGATIGGIIVIAHDFNGSIRNVGGGLKITPQLGCYVNADKFNANFQNKLKSHHAECQQLTWRSVGPFQEAPPIHATLFRRLSPKLDQYPYF